MHAPRGSNDRNCEKNVNRNNGNRLFDSQNNAKGGYACPRPRVGPNVPVDKTYYYAGSKQVVEWTNQHGCGTNPMTSCEVVIQYACEDTLDPTKKYRHTEGEKTFIGSPRDGTPQDENDAATDRIPEGEPTGKADTVKNRRYGMHESPEWYKSCKTRSRNKGLFTADQNVRNEATGTRQNPNGNRRGLECPEERDYFPYWLPNPWRDIAVITSNPERCAYYAKESQNVKPRKQCTAFKEAFGESYIQRYMCPLSQSATSTCGVGSFEQMVKWHPKHPATAALNTDVKESDQGAVLKQLISALPLGTGAATGAATGDALKANPPAANIRWQTWGTGSMESCPIRTGDKDGCPEGYSILDGACAQVGKTDSYDARGAVSNTNFMRVSGFFTAKQAGKHTFHVSNEPGAMLWLDGQKAASVATVEYAKECPFTADGWKLVRRTDGVYTDADGKKHEGRGHPSTDQLVGTDTYGTASADPKSAGSFSVDFETAVPGFDEYMFTSGDCSMWMVMSKSAVMGWYGNEKRDVLRSSDSFVPYKARMYRRNNVKEDPWIQPGLEHSQQYALYVGNSYRAQGGRGVAKNNEGLNVYIRTNPEAAKGAWVAANAMTLAVDQQVAIVGTGGAGYYSKVSVGVTLPSGATVAPMDTQGKSSAMYELTATKAGTSTVTTQISQTRATAKCECDTWTPDYGSGNSCMQPSKDPKEAPWCICKPGPKTVAGTAKNSGWAGTLLAVGEMDDVGMNLMHPFDSRPGALPCGAKACSSYYTGIGGSRITNLKASDKFKGGRADDIRKVSVSSTNFETIKNYGNNYGAVLEGYVVAPETGEYVMLTNSDDDSEVWVATKPDIKTDLVKAVALIGCCREITGTVKISMEKGKKYYIKGLMKEGGGGDYLKIGIKLGNKKYMPIPLSMMDAPALQGAAPVPKVSETSLCNAMCSNTIGCTAWEAVGTKCKMYKGDVTISDSPGAFPVQMEEMQLKKGHLASAKFKTSEEFQLTFQITIPAEGNKQNWPNILHMTTDTNCCSEGSRTPALWFIGRSLRIHARMDRIGRANDGCDTGKELEKGKTSKIDIALSGTKFSVTVNGEELCANNNYATKYPGQDAQKFYLSDPWHSLADAKIKNMEYIYTGSGNGDVYSGKPNQAAPVWAYCDASTATGRRLLSTESEWEEFDESTALATVEAKTMAPVDEKPTNIDCVSGYEAFSRENQLGNARGTASNSDEDKAAIPHSLNANRYIWTVPNHVEGNCVLRIRYNISTSDYWAWNNAGTPMTDGKFSQRNNGNRRRGKTDPEVGASPIVQDPYMGVGPDPTLHFLSMSSNTNQYGRTFQDRSWVFEIKARPANLANAKIYNLGMRGKRGNIVQTYPSVEYDFMPNDLCINKGDYVHFQWTGSDYNPARNPNDGEGAGDATPYDEEPAAGSRRRRASRADRTNLIDQDQNSKIQYRYTSKDKLGLSGAQNFGISASGMQNPMGAANPYTDIDTKYTGMFWTEDGKVDKATILKFALLNQHEKLAKTSKKCMTIDELEALNNNNDEERHPRNCAKMNANMDANGQRTPYFDGGLVKMNKGGVFPYMSTRNNNFSNRNMMGSMCVADGAVGKCNGKACQELVENELLDKLSKELNDGSSNTGTKLIQQHADMKAKKLNRLKEEQRKLAKEIAAMEN